MAFLDMADIDLNSFVTKDDDLGDGSEGSDLGSLSDGDIERTDEIPDAQQAFCQQMHNFNHTGLSTLWFHGTVSCFMYEVFHQGGGGLRYLIFRASQRGGPRSGGGILNRYPK